MRRVAIVGAGWAGLACAIAAAGSGARVDVFEQREPWSEAPVHLDVAPEMMRSLAALGLAERCVRSGFPYRGLVLMDVHGRLCTELPRTRLAGPQLPGAMGLTGQSFSDALLDTALARGVQIHWSAKVRAIDFDGEAAVVQPVGQAPWRPDLVVLATGAEAACHALPFVPEPAVGQLTWWCGLMPRPAGLDQPTLVLAAPGSKALLVPVSGDTAGLALIDTRLNVPRDGALPAERVRQWLRAQGGRLAQTASLVNDTLTLRPARARAGLRSGPWHRGNLVCVGDAAHAMSQYQSTSAAQALEDAVVLGELLAGAIHAAAAAPAPSSGDAGRVCRRCSRSPPAPSNGCARPTAAPAWPS